MTKSRDIRRWVLPAVSMCTAGMLMLAPLAWADDDDHGGDMGDDDRAPAQVMPEDEHENEVEVERVEVQHEDMENEDVENEEVENEDVAPAVQVEDVEAPDIDEGD